MRIRFIKIFKAVKEAVRLRTKKLLKDPYNTSGIAVSNQSGKPRGLNFAKKAILTDTRHTTSEKSKWWQIGEAWLRIYPANT